MSQDSAEPAAPPRTAAFGFVFATALMNAVSFGIMIPILPNLLKQFVHGDTAAASEWNVLFGVTWGTMQFLVGPALGMLSDRYGRRPVLLISIFGLFIDFLFMAFAPSLAWLYVGRILNGVTAASFSTANAYVADITPPDRRARNFGIMGSAIGFGFVIGPTVGGLLGDISLQTAFCGRRRPLPSQWALRSPSFLPSSWFPSAARKASIGAGPTPWAPCYSCAITANCWGSRRWVCCFS